MSLPVRLRSGDVCVCAELKKEQGEGDEPRAETESESEEELSCFAPTVSVLILGA